MKQMAIWIEGRLNANDRLRELNEWLDKGWTVRSVTPQQVSVSVGGGSGTEFLYGGSLLVVLEKTT